MVMEEKPEGKGADLRILPGGGGQEFSEEGGFRAGILGGGGGQGLRKGKSAGMLLVTSQNLGEGGGVLTPLTP